MAAPGVAGIAKHIFNKQRYLHEHVMGRSIGKLAQPEHTIAP
jgi:hypothetical protein